jgi:hypothetical protein
LIPIPDLAKLLLLRYSLGTTLLDRSFSSSIMTSLSVWLVANVFISGAGGCHPEFNSTRFDKLYSKLQASSLVSLSTIDTMLSSISISHP